MTDEDIATAIASKLTGEFYVGQRVRFKDFVGYLAGVVVTYQGPCFHNGNALVQFMDGERWDVHPHSIEPAV